MDELARTQGSKSAVNIVRDAFVEASRSTKLRIIIGCRDHVYSRYIVKYINRYHNWPPYTVRLKTIKNDRVAEELSKISKLSLNSNDQSVQLVSKVPLFLSVIRKDIIEKNKLKSYLKKYRSQGSPESDSQARAESEFRRLLVDSVVTCTGLASGGDMFGAYQKPGDVAERMLSDRRDFLDDEKLVKESSGLLDTIIGTTSKSSNANKHWPLFVKEAGQWRFVHQSIREFILAANIKSGFEKIEDPRSVVT